MLMVDKYIYDLYDQYHQYEMLQFYMLFVMSVYLQQEGVLKPYEYFDAEIDCEKLRSSMKGMGEYWHLCSIKHNC